MIPTYALLGLLIRGEQHGYDLKRTIDREFAPFWRIDFAQLYRSLAKMGRAGWVKVHIEPSPRGPNRKVYTLTARGRAVFEMWLTEPAHSHDEFLVKLRLATLCNAPVAPLVDAQRRVLESEHAARVQTHRAAREAGDASRLVLADAALRETEASLTTLALCTAVISTTRRTATATPLPGSIVITGSDDPLLARLAQFMPISTHAVGSFGGLLALAQHEADVAGIHLLDPETGEYNVPFVKHLLPEEAIVLVNLAFRENGLMLASGNPRNIRGLSDLARRDLRFINRQRGAGTRLLLYARLRAAGIDPRSLKDWERAAATHDAVAGAIATGVADVGPGLRAVACTWGLDFIPLGEERYDLVIPGAAFDSPHLRPLLDALNSQEFYRLATEFQGYDLTRTGQVVARMQ